MSKEHQVFWMKRDKMIKTVSVHKDVYMGGERNIYMFSNHYGASVIRNGMSYGGDRGLWEVAVLDNNGNICYDTPITSDVIGYLTWEGVEKILKKISKLPLTS